MEWTQLKAAERCWDLSSQKKALLAEQIYRTATEPKTFTLPPMRPALAVLAVVVLLFGLLLLWPKNNIEEEVAVLPGAADATTDEYVEKQEGDPTPDSQSQGVIPPKKEEESEEQKNPTSTEQKQEEPKEEESKAETPVENGIAFVEALSVAQNKARDINFNKALSAQQREALSLYLATENYLYLQGQNEGHISGFKELGDGQYILQIRVFTTKEAVGKDLTASPLVIGGAKGEVKKVDSKVLSIADMGKSATCYLRVLKKELKDSFQYLKNITLETVRPQGRMELEFELFGALSAEDTQKIIDHYLGVPEVTWIALSYKTIEKGSVSSAVHRFWETEKEMTYDEAYNIVLEKVTQRHHEKLSEKERMAFYVVFSEKIARQCGYAKDKNRALSNSASIEIITNSVYCGDNLQNEFLQFSNSSLIKKWEFDHDGKIIAASGDSVHLPNQVVSSFNEMTAYAYNVQLKSGGRFCAYFKFDQAKAEECEQYLKQMLQHALSLDCASAVDIFIHETYSVSA